MKLLLIVLFSINLLSSELVLSKMMLQKNGYQKQDYAHKRELKTDETGHKLSWPFDEPYKKGFIGNNFAQFQPYSPTPGYHGGVDMILEKSSWVNSPISGRLEAGHYGYENNPNGSATKWWKPWPQTGEDAYFEVAVIADNGLRYELHHLDRSSLTKEIIAQLKSDTPQIKEGQRIARVYTWRTFFHYHHVHLNVIDPAGNSLNPESHFETIEDSIAPTIKFLAVYKNKSQWINNKDTLSEKPEAIIFIGYDKKNSNQFNQAPLIYRITNMNKTIAEYSFLDDLKGRFSKVQDLRDVYPKHITLPNGKVLNHNTGYYPREVEFAVKLNFKETDLSKVYNLEVLDANNNKTFLEFSL